MLACAKRFSRLQNERARRFMPAHARERAWRESERDLVELRWLCLYGVALDLHALQNPVAGDELMKHCRSDMQADDTEQHPRENAVNIAHRMPE